MYDIPELEKKWRKYKRNKIKKPLIISISSLLLLGAAGFAILKYINNSNSANTNVAKNSVTPVVQKPVATTNNNQSKPAMIIVKNNPSNPNNSSSSGTNQLVNIQPTTQNGTVANEQTNNSQDGTIDLSKATIVKPDVPDDDIRVIGFDNKGKKDIEQKYGDILLPKKATEDIEEREHIKELEDKFKETQNPEDSLEIAKYYYSKGDYKKAEDWAVNTNNIDGDLEDSWLIFAKSRAKQGNRVDAIKVLQSFYDETNSKKAKALLDKLRRGKSFD